MLLILIKWAVVFAVIAFVYREILSREKILNWWFKFGLQFEKRFFYRPIWGSKKLIVQQNIFHNPKSGDKKSVFQIEVRI